MIARSLVVWVGLLALAFLNGLFREAVLSARLGPSAANVLSTFTLCTLILLLTSVTIEWIQPLDTASAWTIGLTWLTLTVAFEFLAGHYLFGSPWPTLVADYNVLKGRVWILVLLTILTAPAMMAGSRQVPRS
jgi:hypothetical protein